MMGRRRARAILVVFGAALLLVILGSGTAVADHLVVNVVGPDSATLGEEVEIRTSVRSAETGDAVPDVDVVFYSDAQFAGVTGEVELGRVTTDEAGVAVFRFVPSVSGTHAVRIEAIAGPEVQPESVSIPVPVGVQQVRSVAGVEIPGLGGWLVTVIVVGLWTIMLVAITRMIAVARAGPSRRAFGVAEGIGVVALLVTAGLATLLARSPDTHANLDPEGYRRTPIAYTQAHYLYPGPGLTQDISAEESVAYGRALFMSRGCAGCHGIEAGGTVTARSPAFASRAWLGQVVRTGLPGGMPSYTEVDLGEDDVDAIFVFLFAARSTIEDDVTPPTAATTTTVAAQATPFAETILPILQEHCAECHGSLGGWDSTSYESVMSSGDHAPVVIPGDPEESLLVRKIRGIQSEGLQMPPTGLMSEAEIQTIVDWVAMGAEG